MRISFTIPGKPYAKKRPRFSRKLGRAFDPAENGQFEGAVGQIAIRHFPQPISGPVSLMICATFGVPQSWSKKKRAAHIERPHTQRPDCDNIAKAICDGLNRIAWADDSPVAQIIVRKVWGLTDSTAVIVETAE